jgi:hypothetical protein
MMMMRCAMKAIRCSVARATISPAQWYRGRRDTEDVYSRVCHGNCKRGVEETPPSVDPVLKLRTCACFRSTTYIQHALSFLMSKVILMFLEW